MQRRQQAEGNDAGLRIFQFRHPGVDIRDPVHPTEIAYFNPAGTTTASVGSNHATIGQWRAGGPDSCSAQVHLNADNGTLWSTRQDNGFLMLKFTNGVWPFPQSKTPAGGRDQRLSSLAASSVPSAAKVAEAVVVFRVHFVRRHTRYRPTV